MQKSQRELALLKKEALGGNKDAAWTVFLHYELGLRRREAAWPWVTLATTLDNPSAKKYLEELKIAQPSTYKQYLKTKRLPTASD